MPLTLTEVAELVGGRVLRPEHAEFVVHGVSAIGEGREGTITFCAHQKYLGEVDTTAASAVLINAALVDEAALPAKPAVACEVADYGFALVAERLHGDPPPRPAGTVHPTAVVADSAILGENLWIGPYVVVDEKATVGDGCVLEAFSYVGYKARLGKGCHLYQQAVVREHCVLGSGVILQPGAIVGSDGFGYVPVDGQIKKIPQLGNVVIEDGAEVGANTTLDRARFERTRLGPGVKLDNLIQIAHNCDLGAGTMIAALTGIAGSTKVGRGCLIGGQVGFVGHTEVGDGAQIAAGASVTKNLDGGRAYLGAPAGDAEEGKRIVASQRRVPELLKRVRELERKLAKLEEDAPAE